MYGKSFESMYTGSMVGAGFHVFAVWQYVITNTHHSHIELNPKLLAFTLAGTEDAEKEVQDALDYLCSPDPKSRSRAEDGRRLIKEGQYLYRVVNWEDYQRIKSSEQLKEYNRRKQSEYRERKKHEQLRKIKGTPLKGERSYCKAVENGDTDLADKIASGEL